MNLARTSYVVCGPESAGNYLLRDILISGGCKSVESPGDDDSDHRPVSAFDLPNEGPIVWRRSVPYAGRWDLANVFARLLIHDWQPVVVMPVRQPVALMRSQVAAGHVTVEATAESNAMNAVKLIAERCNTLRLPFVPVPQESLMTQSAVAALQEFLGLRPTGRPIATDANAKHWRS